MGLKEQLLSDLNVALRQGDTVRAAAIRMLRNSIQYEEKAHGQPLDEDAVLFVLSRQAKERRESIEAFKAGHRQDLVDKESAELSILETYLPEQLSAEELLDEARKAVAEVGASEIRDMGKVMATLMPRVKGKADGGAASRIVNQLLSGESS